MKKILIPLVSLAVILLILLLVLIGIPMFEDVDNPKVNGSEDWMSDLPGESLLSEMNIPGSHDSATQHVQFSFFSKCQVTDIGRQLEDGYRYLDIRLGIETKKDRKKLALMHGFSYCKEDGLPFSGHLYLEKVLEECYDFLDEHPGETILFVVKQEHGDESVSEFEQLLDEYIKGNDNYWLLSDKIPSLEAARGKLVLFRRYEDEAGLGADAGIPFIWKNQDGYSNVSLSADIADNGAYSLFVQDRYEYNIEDKWNAFKAGAAIDNNAKPGDVKLNFLSTKGSFSYGHPFKYAKELNSRFMDEAYNTPSGWTIVDYSTAAIAEKIYSTNGRELYAGMTYYLSSYNKRIKSGDIEVIEKVSDTQVYTFLQGPRSWESKVDWSGSWCNEKLEGNYFGEFGCGMCCMANIYDTLSEKEGSPLDAYYFARENSGYLPDKKTGAIGWGNLKVSLRKMGMICDLYYKPKTYEEFQEEMANCKSIIALVTSNEDDTFWQHTNGHYVNIWLYDDSTDMVFLAEPGSPDNNRTWIPLRYVYDALKTISKYQYIRVDGYDPKKDNWNPTGIIDNWSMPAYYTSK